MWFRFLLTAVVLAVVLYLQFFYDFKSAINTEPELESQGIESAENSGP